MAETFKLRVKVGIHEFDAEGPKDEVNARFEAWQEMIRAPAQPAGVTLRTTGTVTNPIPTVEAPLPRIQSLEAVRVFSVDERRDLVTLRIHPQGETADADAVLVLVYGYLEMLDIDEVQVTKLTQSVRKSGLRADRIDRAAAPHVRSNLLIKTGTGKGGRYTLSNTGRERAEALVKELYSRVA